ncbi:hypothetical protein HIM_09739 [Hirsutella minnesotensis 3608]|uniref:Zn(2)-C6 fungal-type domain-containing protein n=1 Tax=Hirsutella minnesotensis 3608 TaxID=1043627 RepID=A0A0F8A2Y2_9HYPO|nr:hypothetical protein HIM_09739 [Hirsutella minnesotensis 3608]
MVRSGVNTTQPDGRRSRPIISCSLCRRRKIRCNRESPCNNCIRSNNQDCSYDNPKGLTVAVNSPVRHTQRGNSQLAPKPPEDAYKAGEAEKSGVGSADRQYLSPAEGTAGSLNTSKQTEDSGPESQRLKRRIKELEEQLADVTKKSKTSPEPKPVCNIETVSSWLSGTFHVHHDESNRSVARGISHKTRFFGQSHWGVNAVLLIRDLFESLDQHLTSTSTACSSMEKCKILARVIKAHRAPEWPCPATSPLPPKELCDALVDSYLKNTESIFRIIHVPSFRKSYDTAWVPGNTPEVAWLVQLKLVLALGAVCYDDKFSLRTMAVRWVYEGQTWIAEPKFKSRLDLQLLQTNLLLALAQERVGVGGDAMWITIGTILRKAICIGLHRDPSKLPRRSALEAEICRRLWNTIIELTLLSSLAQGMPPLISMDDFDTESPGNFNDDELETEQPVARSTDHFTQVSAVIALRESFPQRLAVVKLLSSLDSSSQYEETLQIDAELRASLQSLRQRLKALRISRQTPMPEEFQLADFMMHRYLLSLHNPWFCAAMKGRPFAFSRNVIVEASLKLWRLAVPVLSPNSADSTAPTNDTSLPRLATLSSGLFPTTAIQSALLIALDLRAQLQDSVSLGPIYLRPDLVSVLHDSVEWCRRCIEAGTTNVKGYMLMSLLTTKIEGLRRGSGHSENTELLVKAVENVAETSLLILKNLEAAQRLDMGPLHNLTQTASILPEEVTKDWSLKIHAFDSRTPESFDWIFNDDMMPGQPFVF